MNEEKNDGLAVVGDENSGAEEAQENVTVAHDDVRRQVLSLRDKTDEDYWSLSVVLREVHDNDYYREWGFDSWKEYVEQEVDIHIRKAQYLVKLQSWFDGMTPAIQKWIRALGWTKARMLMHVVTQENAQDWKNRVADKTVSEIKEMLEGDKDSEGEDGAVSESGSSETPDDKSHKFKATLMGTQWETVQSALEKAKEAGETDKDGQALSLICVDYLATNTNILTRTDMMEQYEKIWGVKLIAVELSTEDGEEDLIVFGGDYLEDQGDDGEEDKNEGEE